MNNWEKNKSPITNKSYKSKEEALLTGGAMIKKQFPDTKLYLGDREITFKKKK